MNRTFVHEHETLNLQEDEVYSINMKLLILFPLESLLEYCACQIPWQFPEAFFCKTFV
jgi:hypothetical protein